MHVLGRLAALVALVAGVVIGSLVGGTVGGIVGVVNVGGLSGDVVEVVVNWDDCRRCSFVHLCLIGWGRTCVYCEFLVEL